jgi:hypothetical protein
METFFSAKSVEQYVCDFCHTVCSKKNDWDRHLRTSKHLRNSGTNMEPPKPALDFNCKCGKHYNTKSGLWKHTKTCLYKPVRAQYIKNDPHETFPPDISFLTNLVLEVVKNNTELQKQNNEYQKQNQEFQKQMLDLYKTTASATVSAAATTTNHISHHTNNSHNKTFNLQFFLNEQCKNAMNIMEFVDSMTLELADLENVGKLGYVEGISNIIIRKLNEMDVYTRPIHCSDAKREIMYVKDDNIWEKENSTYDKLRKAIKQVTYKNSALLLPWSQKYPACMNNQHHLNDVYIQLVGQAMGGKGEFVDSENKIMKKIARAVLIEKV